ncbi:MAG: rubrerythrin [Ilumatobacter sp.]
MTALDGSETHANLAEAFINDSARSALHAWFAQQADIEGRPEEAAQFRARAATGLSAAHGHLEFLADVGDPLFGQAIGDTDDNLAASASAVSSRETAAADHAVVARGEGLAAIADWFETLATPAASDAAGAGS